MSPHLIGLLAPAPEPVGDMALTYANTAWLLVASAMVLLMTPGLAFFYGGMTRAKSTLTIPMLEKLIMIMLSVLFALVMPP